MADTPPGAGYVSGPYDHPNDNPPHQHGGTDAPECTTCLPVKSFFDDFDPHFNRSEIFGPSPWNGLTEVPEAPPWAPRTIFKYAKFGRRAQLENDIRNDQAERYRQSLGVSTESRGKEGEPMVIRDEQYPGDDAPQQWSRRGLSEHIRLELEVLGLLPGKDGFVRPPAGRDDEGTEGLRGESAGDEIFGHAGLYLDKLVEDGVISPDTAWRQKQLLPTRFGIPREPDGPAPDGHYWDGYRWVEIDPDERHRQVGYDAFSKRQDTTEFDGKHPPVHFDWIDGFKIEDRVYRPEDVTILLKWFPLPLKLDIPTFDFIGGTKRQRRRAEEEQAERFKRLKRPDDEIQTRILEEQRGPGFILRADIEKILGFRLTDERWADLRDYYFYQAGKGD